MRYLHASDIVIDSLSASLISECQQGPILYTPGVSDTPIVHLSPHNYHEYLYKLPVYNKLTSSVDASPERVRFNLN